MVKVLALSLIRVTCKIVHLVTTVVWFQFLYPVKMADFVLQAQKMWDGLLEKAGTVNWPFAKFSTCGFPYGFLTSFYCLAIWLWRNNEKVHQKVRCRAFGDQAIVFYFPHFNFRILIPGTDLQHFIFTIDTFLYLTLSKNACNEHICSIAQNVYVTRQAKRDLQGINYRNQFFRINWSINY